MNKCYAVALAFLFLLASTTPIIGQNQQDGKALTLDDCIALAIKNSPEYQYKLIQHEQTRLDESSKRNAFLPSVQGALGNSWDFGRSQDKTGVLKDQSSQSLSGSIGASVVLFSGFSRLHELKGARLQTEASIYNLAQARQDLGIQVTQLYFALLHSQRVVNSAKLQQERSAEQEAYARAMYQQGKWGVDKVTDAEANTAQSTLNLTQAESNAEQAKLDLEQALSVHGITIADLSIPEAIRQAKDEQLLGNDYLAQALKTRPSLKANDLSQASLQEQIKAQRSGYMPSLSLNIGYNNNYYKVLGNDVAQFNLPFSEQIRQNGRSYIGFNITIPIFDAFRTRTQLRLSKLNLLGLKTERLALETRLRKEVESAVLALNLAERSLQATEASLKASDKALYLVEASWKAGRSTNEALRSASNRKFVAEIDLLNAQARYILQAYLLKFYLNK